MIQEKTHDGRTVYVQPKQVGTRHWDATWSVSGGLSGHLGELAPSEGCAVDEAFSLARRAIDEERTRADG